jgi:UDP-2-acetamido-3-amino-2,3-dideoxy-glucuronate N-acetyltransferase
MSDMNWHQHVGGAPFEKRDIATSAKIGARCKVWAFARILSDVIIGDDVNIGGGTEIGRGSVIGNGTHIGAGCFFPPDSRIGADVFVGPGVLCADDMHPVAHNPAYFAQPPIIEDGACIGIGAVLLPGITIGKNGRVAARTLVTREVAEATGVKGSPSRAFEIPSEWHPLSPLAEDALNG